MKSFDEFLSEKAAKEEAEARTQFDDAVADIQGVDVKSKADVTTILSEYAALSDDRKAKAGAIASYFKKARERRSLITQILAKSSYDDFEKIETLPNAAHELIEAELKQLETEETKLRGSIGVEKVAHALVQKIAELNDKKKLTAEIEKVAELRGRIEKLQKIKLCRKQCETGPITSQLTKRRRDILTPSLQQSMKDELEALQLTHIPLEVSDHGERGESIVQVSLTAAQQIAKNSEVLSEGEQRALALSCFLAELNEIGQAHGMVVDDPVSSLDHTRMEAVAKRLVEEASRGRQVIVFTHNIYFHYMVTDAAQRASVACHEAWMTKLGKDRFGIIDDAQKPWQMKPVSERIHEIERTISALKSEGYDPLDEKFRNKIEALYSDMRTTWERLIEEILFNKVVQRFRPEIMTLRLRGACFDPKSDYEVIEKGMTKTSRYSGHDTAEGVPSDLPTVSDIESDLSDMHDFGDQVRARRKLLEKNAKQSEAGVTPELL